MESANVWTNLSDGMTSSAAGGVPQNKVHACRLLGSLFFCLELVTLLVAVTTMMPMLPQFWLTNRISASLIAAALFMHAW